MVLTARNDQCLRWLKKIKPLARIEKSSRPHKLQNYQNHQFGGSKRFTTAAHKIIDEPTAKQNSHCCKLNGAVEKTSLINGT